MMRLILLSLLLAAAFSHGQVVTEECWDGTFIARTTPSSCPPQLSQAVGGAEISDTAALTTVTTDLAGGTIYAYLLETVTPGVCPAEPDVADIKSGDGSLVAIAPSLVSAPGAYEFALTGLDPATEFCSYFYHEDGRRVGEWALDHTVYVASSDPWSTLSGAPGAGPGADLETLAARFIRTGGSDSADGLTDTTAWLTTANATSLPAGTKVYLRQNDVFQSQKIRVNWNGSSSDRVVIGCYYLDTSNSNQVTDCNEGSGNGFTAKPILRGTLTSECMAAYNCSYTASLGGLSDVFDAHVRVDTDYVTVQDIRVEFSKGRSFTARGLGTGNGIAEHVTFQRVEGVNSGFQPLVAENRVQHLIVRDSLFRYYNHCEVQSHAGGPVPNIAQCGSGGHPGGVGVFRSKPAYALIENNDIYHGDGEGINCAQSSHMIIRGNRVGNAYSSTIYLGHCENTLVEHNIVWGNPNIDRFTTRSGSQNGISLSLESFAVTEPNGGGDSNNVVRNNLVMGATFCIGANSISNEAAAAGMSIGARFYGNTCIGPEVYGIFVNRGGSASAALGTFDFANNVVHSDVGSANIANIASGGAKTFSHNYFTATPSNSGAANNAVTGSIELQVTIAQGRAFHAGNLPDIEDFRLGATSVALAAGLDLSATDLPQLAPAEWGGMTTEIEALTHSACATTWYQNALPVDFDCAVRGTPPDIGGVEF